jgi:hypothetical protein
MNEAVGSNTSALRKRTMLRQMGVDVWLARSGPGEQLAELSAATVGPTASAVQQKVPPPAADRVEPAEPPVTQPQPAGSPVAPFSVLCLVKGRALMLVELGESRSARRFALDVLAASSGIWGGESTHLAFDWPQPGVENQPGTVRKALGAFVSKQLGDHQPSLVLIGREVAERLEQIPDGSVVLAPFAELMVEGEQKRALWAELEGRR